MRIEVAFHLKAVYRTVCREAADYLENKGNDERYSALLSAIDHLESMVQLDPGVGNGIIMSDMKDIRKLWLPKSYEVV